MSAERLPPKGHPAREVHDRLLSATRYLRKAHRLMLRTELTADGREMLLEETTDLNEKLTELERLLTVKP